MSKIGEYILEQQMQEEEQQCQQDMSDLMIERYAATIKALRECIDKGVSEYAIDMLIHETAVNRNDVF